MLRCRLTCLAFHFSAALVASAAFYACGSGSDAGSPPGDAGTDLGKADNYNGGGGGGYNPFDAGGAGGSGGGGNPLPDGSDPPCTLSVSGAATLSFPCLTTTDYFTAVKRTTFIINVADPRPLQSLSISLGHEGFPSTGTWTSTDPGASGGVSVEQSSTEAGAPTWQCVASPASPEDGGAEGGTEGGTTDAGADSGNGSCYTLNLTIGQGIPTSTGESFGSTGTFDALLDAVPQTGATGTIKIHVDF